MFITNVMSNDLNQMLASNTTDFANKMSVDPTTGISIEWWIEMIHLISQIDKWHEQLPSPFNMIMDKILLNHVPYADEYLFLICIVLCILIIIQTKALTRPPPVPLKSLPKRPCLLIQFQPDDPKLSTTNQTLHSRIPLQHLPMKGTATTTPMSTTATNSGTTSTIPKNASFIQRIDGFMSQRLPFRRQHRNGNTNISTTTTTTSTNTHHPYHPTDTNPIATPTSSIGRRYHHYHPLSSSFTTTTTTHSIRQGFATTTTPLSFSKMKSKMVGHVETIPDGQDDDHEDDDDEWQNVYDQDDDERDYDDVFRKEQGSIHHPLDNNKDEIPFVISSATMQDLPDSFAPLLSSSYMTMLTQQLTGDLIHAVQMEGEIRLRTGRHEVPLDKDTSRPQFVLDVSEHSSGCRISAVAVIGSDGLSMEQDMDVHRPTTSRSKPMVKHAGIVFDPPLPLSNVAPTLIHFPTLFEDRNMIPTLRSIQFVRYIVDFIVSISSFLEKCLWILESQCQIHLSKVRITPIYKGQNKNQKSANTGTATNDTTTTMKSPKWRLQLAFSGHVLIFGWIPIPFISVVLPSFIIPQPHALLDYLLSSQPLASARLRRENIAEERIALAVLDTIETWNTELKVVATPPAIAVDLTLPGGVSIAVEAGLWRDHQAGRDRESDAVFRQQNAATGGPRDINNTNGQGIGAGTASNDAASVNSMSSWTTKHEAHSRQISNSFIQTRSPPHFDANLLVPWLIELSAKGTISHEKLSVHVLKLAATQSGSPVGVTPTQQKSQFMTRGSFAIWKLRTRSRTMSVDSDHKQPQGNAIHLTPAPRHRRTRSAGRVKSTVGHPELETDDSPSVAAIFLFPDETSSFHNDLRMLQYDYLFDVSEESKLDAVTISIGATHPMLNGGTMITTILDSIYAFGSMAAREDSVLDPIERRRKRNILRHLPAIDFTFGIQNIYIPNESDSYSDDGQSLFLPEIEGGRMMIRFLGGMDETEESSVGSAGTFTGAVSDGIMLVADFEVPSLVMNVDSFVKEFPELDILEGARLHTLLSGLIGGSIKAHLRPQKHSSVTVTTGPNVFNPLEAYEIDFSRSSLSVKMKEFSSTLGHRRIMFPAETTFYINVLESVVDMGFEGRTKCDLSWDFQGLSPILQIATPGLSPVDALPENKVQVSLLISPLRQGRFSMNVSSVGGISITKAATSREDKEGLFDWKFFNALVSPGQGAMGRMLDVLNDSRTVDKLLQIVRVINEDLHEILRYSIKQLRRAKGILDQEGVLDPGHAIPMYKLARLVSLFLTDDVEQVDNILPVIKRVISGDGLDVVKLKDLLRQNLEIYDEWAPEIDRITRWAAICFGPMPVTQPYVEDQVTPLAELPHYAIRFESIPSASQLYETLLDKPQLPLDPGFSNLVSRVAPYLSFRQVAYILEVRASSDWQPSDLRRIRYVYSIKRKVLEIAESYGGLSFLPQSFFLSVFLGEATRSSLRASSIRPTMLSKRLTSTVRSLGRTRRNPTTSISSNGRRSNSSTFARFRRRHFNQTDHGLQKVPEDPSLNKSYQQSQGLESFQEFNSGQQSGIPENLVVRGGGSTATYQPYELGDSLLGPQDVAILLQAGLTSVMKSSTVVQLNQRMLLDLICSQPRTFAIAVLAELGNTPRGLTSALMALLELDQTAFKADYQIDMHALIESWLPEIKIPRREDHMAGGRWARQGYYDALFSVAVSISEDAETYIAVKNHLQQVRHSTESCPLPKPRDEPISDDSGDNLTSLSSFRGPSKLSTAIAKAISLISEADKAGKLAVENILINYTSVYNCEDCVIATQIYRDSFEACEYVLSLDKNAFQSPWFSDFYRRNYNALMILSMYENVVDDVDCVRYWLGRLLRGATGEGGNISNQSDKKSEWLDLQPKGVNFPDNIFDDPSKFPQQLVLDAIIEATIYKAEDRNSLRSDPLVRLLIQNPPGNYNFVIVSAAGVITEGKRGLELKDAFLRLEKKRGVKVIRADTATARSIEYNASKVEEAIEAAVRIKKPYGLLGYSQGCANALMAESLLLSGTPNQQNILSSNSSGLVCRQLLFSAANGSFHGPAVERKIQRLITLCEDFFKSQSGYFSRAFSSTVLAFLNSVLDSADFHKLMGGAHSFLPDGCRAFWRESQHLSHVPTCVLRGVMESHTTPESLEMLSNLLTKQSGSALHDSQVHVFDAVGYPVYHLNRNGKILQKCAVGDGAIQRTHHWSPLSDEVEFVRTARDLEMASFDCAKDRHVFPWVEVNKRFGFIKFSSDRVISVEAHPSKLRVEKASKT